MSPRRISVEIVGDSRSLERAFARSTKSAEKFQMSVTGMGRGLNRMLGVFGVGLGARAIVGGLKSMTDAASNLNEQIAKTDVVFGSSASDVEAWAKTTSTALGESEAQALTLASSFGALFAPMGLVGEQAAKQSEKLTQLGADLASFYNTDVQDALDAIQSGLVGQVRPLRRYGVLLSAARVQAEAMAETGKKSAKQLTEQDKVLARINIIFRDTTKAQGDFQRSSNRLAGQEKILTAQTDDLKGSLGEALLPAVTRLVKKFNEWLADPEHKQKVIDDWTTSVNDLAAAVIFAADAFDKLSTARDKLKDWPGKGPSGIDIAKSIFDWAKHPNSFLFPGGTKAGVAGPPVTLQAIAAAAANAAKAAAASVAAAHNAPAGISGAGTAGTRAVPVGTATVTQRNQWFDTRISRMIDRVQDIPSLRGQVARLKQIAGLLRQRMDVTKDITRRLTLEDTLVDVLRQIRQNQQQIGKEADAAAKARAANTYKLAKVVLPNLPAVVSGHAFIAANVARLQRMQFRLLGFTGTGDERAPRIRALARRTNALARRIQGTPLDTPATRMKLGRIGAVLAGAAGEPTDEVLFRIRQMLDDISSAIGDSQKTGTITGSGFARFSPNKLAAMLGLAGNRQAAATLAQLGAGGTLPGGTGRLGAGRIIIGTAHFHGVQNVRQLENELSKVSASRPARRRGAR